MISRVPERIRENIPKSVAIVGVGGIGSWTAMLFSQIKGVERLGLFDEDLVEESNLERTWFKQQDLNTKKSVAMKDQIKARRTDINVLAYDHLTEENKNLLNLYDLKVVCADKRSVRQMVLELSNSISAGYDIDEEKDWISVSESMLWSLSGDDEDDQYTIEPSWGVPAMMGALITVHSVITGKRPISVSSQITDFYKTVKDSNSRRTFSLYGDHDFDTPTVNEDDESSELNFPFDDIKEKYEFYDVQMIDILSDYLDELPCPYCNEVGNIEHYPEYDEVYCDWCDEPHAIDSFKEYLRDIGKLPKFIDFECPNCNKQTLLKETVNETDIIGCLNCETVMNEDGQMENPEINFPFEELYDEYELLGYTYNEILHDRLQEIECTDCNERMLMTTPQTVDDGENEYEIFIECGHCGTRMKNDELITELINVGKLKAYEDKICGTCGSRTFIKQTIMNKKVYGCMKCRNVEYIDENEEEKVSLGELFESDEENEDEETMPWVIE